MSPAQGGRPDRIGSLFDGACPTAATPDTGMTERLPADGMVALFASSKMLDLPPRTRSRPPSTLARLEPRRSLRGVRALTLEQVFYALALGRQRARR